ncbi:hypothetical protein BKA66DRAFT_410201 [Pyrenochaeta sp. MPI-SDFR-AT-0127]|nr:hypothetical protein BKA66DRAFT_410201 [Pyrenochaeta sp. MPI-SDFR-AT-0127]
MNEQFGSRFFSLPPELRSRIYVELLCPKALSFADLARCSTSSIARDQQRPRMRSPLYPALLSTCRKIHDEAIDFLYELHIFHAHPSLLTAFPHYRAPAKDIIYPDGLSRIKRWQITIRLDIDPRFDLNQCTSAFSGAEYLEIYAWQAASNYAAEAVLRLFEGIRGVRVARVRGSVDVGWRLWLESCMTRPLERDQLLRGLDKSHSLQELW